MFKSCRRHGWSLGHRAIQGFCESCLERDETMTTNAESVNITNGGGPGIMTWLCGVLPDRRPRRGGIGRIVPLITTRQAHHWKT